jgi:hypothetical protein
MTTNPRNAMPDKLIALITGANQGIGLQVAGTDAGPLEAAYKTPAITQPSLRRRPLSERSAA